MSDSIAFASGVGSPQDDTYKVIAATNTIRYFLALQTRLWMLMVLIVSPQFGGRHACSARPCRKRRAGGTDSDLRFVCCAGTDNQAGATLHQALSTDSWRLEIKFTELTSIAYENLL